MEAEESFVKNTDFVNKAVKEIVRFATWHDLFRYPEVSLHKRIECEKYIVEIRRKPTQLEFDF